METFTRYLRNQLLQGMLLSAVVLAGIFSLITLVEELDEIGQGSYSAADVFLFTALTTPGRIFDLLPLIVLLGCIIALGMLAASQQLVVVRALGASIWRILRSVMLTVLAVIGILLVLAEWVIPELEEYAYTLRAVRQSEQSSLTGDQGFWARNGLQFINIREFRLGRIPTGINIYDFSEQGGLVRFVHAESGVIENDSSEWMLQNVWSKEIGENAVQGDDQARHYEQLAWQSFLSNEQIGVLTVPPESLSLSNLFRYVSELRERGQAADVYDLALWHQLAIPFSAIIMALIAVPVATSTTRGQGAAKRIFQAAAVGMLFYLLNTALGYVGLLANASPVVTNFGPVLLLALIAVPLLRRLR